jgi:hypothetical protein
MIAAWAIFAGVMPRAKERGRNPAARLGSAAASNQLDDKAMAGISTLWGTRYEY